MPTVVIADAPRPDHSLVAHMEFTPMWFQAAIACLIILSVSVLIAHAIDAFRT